MQNLSEMITLTDEEKKLLKDNFDEKLKDKDFKELVSLLKIEKEKLYDYTSSLEESSVEFSHCKNCKGLESCKNKLKGYMYKHINFIKGVLYGRKFKKSENKRNSYCCGYLYCCISRIISFISWHV